MIWPSEALLHRCNTKWFHLNWNLFPTILTKFGINRASTGEIKMFFRSPVKFPPLELAGFGLRATIFETHFVRHVFEIRFARHVLGTRFARQVLTNILHVTFLEHDSHVMFLRHVFCTSHLWNTFCPSRFQNKCHLECYISETFEGLNL